MIYGNRFESHKFHRNQCVHRRQYCDDIITAKLSSFGRPDYGRETQSTFIHVHFKYNNNVTKILRKCYCVSHD